MKSRPRLQVEIPTASMADVAFLILIFFMIADAFTSTRGLDMAFPPHTEAAPRPRPDPGGDPDRARGGGVLA